MDWAGITVKYLNEAIGDFPTYHTAPKDKPDKFAVLRLTNILRSNPMQPRPWFIIHLWAKDRKTASDMADAMAHAMFSAPDEITNVFDVNQVGDFDEQSPPLGYRQRVMTFEFVTNE